MLTQTTAAPNASNDQIIQGEPLINATTLVPTVAPGRLEEVTEPSVAEVVGEQTHMNDVVPAIENEVIEQAASEPVVAVEAPVVAPVVAVANAPVVKDTSEEEDLIEGIVNTLIEDDGDGSSEIFFALYFY